MRVPLGWLREYVDFDWPPDELASRLTSLGMEVQSVEEVGGGWNDVVVGELLEVRPHPNAGRLSLTRVDVGAGEPLEIVCGATNIAAGQRVPVALPGSVLPGGRRIEATTIQGAQSAGMLCSPIEIGLGEDADGILILEPDAPIGSPLERIVGDTVIDVDVKPNRGDALSLIGLAREIAALTGERVRWPLIEVPETGDSTTDHLSVSVEATDLCPRFVARYVDGIAVGPSPLRVQLRLAAAGMRPVSNVVDASNYVMLEMGKPIHTFDAASVGEGTIIVRRARQGERLETLDHVERALSVDDLLIADPHGAIGIAGVMGGAGSEVSEATTAVAIESAIFDPLAIRRTAQRHGLRSEASQRFERGQEWRLARLGADRTAQLLAGWAGGRVAAGVVDTNPSDEPLRRLSFRPARVNRLLGAELEPEHMRALLARAEIETEPATAQDSVPVIAGEQPVQVAAQAGTISAVLPSHRRDIVIEADIAEEVARLHGYESLPAALPASPTPAYRPDPRRLTDTLRELLAAHGLNELVSHVLVGPIDHARLGLPASDPATIRLANPVTGDRSEMRRSLLPGLVAALAVNERRRHGDVAVFEVGPIHAYRDGQPWQADRLGILLAGNWQPADWSQAARPADLADAKGLVDWLLDRLAGQPVAYRATDVAAGVEHPGRTAEALVEDGDGVTVVGRVGELDPRYLRAADVRAERALVALLDVEALAALAAARRAPRLGRGPVVERDVAVVVGEDTPSAAVEAIIRRAAGTGLADLRLFDRYQGPPLAAEQVSLAYRLVLDAAERSPTEPEVEAVVRAIADELRSSLGASVRGLEDG